MNNQRYRLGIGVHWSYLVKTEGVAFRNWTEREIREASVDKQIGMHHDKEAMPLIFPCTPARLIQFVDAAPPGNHSFSVPDAFRQAVTERAKATGKAPLVSGDAGKTTEIDTTGMVAWQAVTLKNWPKIVKAYGTRPAAKLVMKWLENNGPRDTIPEEQAASRSLQWIDESGNTKSVTAGTIGNVLSEWRKDGIIQR